jgi:hypothetical protein
MAALANAAKTVAAKMTTYEKFLFDLNGFIVIRNVLSLEEVKAMNDGVDAHIGDLKARESAALKNTVKNTVMSADGSRMDLGGMLGWEAPSGDMFRRLLAHRNISYYLSELCGEGYRLDHQPLVLVQDKNSEGFSLHGGPLSGHDGIPEGKFNPELQYHCRNGTIWNSLLAMSVCLSPSKIGDGGFCAIRGSHKLNFAVPYDFSNGEMDGFMEHAYQPAVNPGDVILFSEATVHGSLPWTAPHQRRLALYRFSPANFAYGRAYLNEFGAGVMDLCTPAQRAVLGAPHAVRLQRNVLTSEGEDGPVKAVLRSEVKMAHDRALFGSDFF